MMKLRTAAIPATLVLLLEAVACGGSAPEQAQEAVRIPGATVVVRDTVLPDLLPAAGLAGRDRSFSNERSLPITRRHRAG